MNPQDTADDFKKRIAAGVITADEVKDIFISIYELLDYSAQPKRHYTLTYSRAIWKSQLFRGYGYSFNKEELDAAEKLDSRFIGVRNGFNCYLQNKFMTIKLKTK